MKCRPRASNLFTRGVDDDVQGNLGIRVGKWARVVNGARVQHGRRLKCGKWVRSNVGDIHVEFEGVKPIGVVGHEPTMTGDIDGGTVGGQNDRDKEMAAIVVDGMNKDGRKGGSRRSSSKRKGFSFDFRRGNFRFFDFLVFGFLVFGNATTTN